MAPCIRVLPEEIVNHIAAGEVVERPSAVVKELVENALDAGSSEVWVELEEGGKRLISVRDNGRGMSEEDAVMSVKRYATSKIQTAQDLDNIGTLGFRGEALSAISSVSRFQLHTCVDESEPAICVKLSEGGSIKTEVVSLPKGCWVKVAELFYNLPARRKFLRSASTELHHIQQVLIQLALAHEHLSLHLRHNGRSIWDWPPATSLKERVQQVFGRTMGSQMLPIEGKDPAFQFKSMMSHPSYSKPNRRWQHLFINCRGVKDVRLSFAIQQAYRTMLMGGKFSAFVMKISLPPDQVDVNVHPTKSEVRLLQPQRIYSVLTTRLHNQLKSLTRSEMLGSDSPTLSSTVKDHATSLASNWDSPPAEPFLASVEHSELSTTHSDFQRSDTSDPAASVDESKSELPQTKNFHFQPLTKNIQPDASLSKHRMPAEDPSPQPGFLEKGLTLLTQFDFSYIIAQREHSLLLIDQHAAHERILFEHYRHQFYRNGIVSKLLLIPFSIELSSQNALLLEQYLPQWKKMGFEIDQFGSSTSLVRQIPAILSGINIKDMVLEVLDELALFGKSGHLEEVFNEILRSGACHAAIRAGDQLSTTIMQEILDELSRLDITLYCPHGRPIWVELSPNELERRFKRKV